MDRLETPERPMDPLGNTDHAMMAAHTAPVVWAEVVEVDVRAGVGLATEVAHKRLATVCPAHVGVHVGLAAPTAHRPQLTQVHNLYVTVANQQCLLCTTAV